MHEKYTVITGASSGIGAQAAKLFARQGDNLILTARRMDLLQDVKEKIEARTNVHVLVYASDLSKPEEALRFYDQASSLPITTWINNAGIGDYHPVGEKIEKTCSLIRLDVEALCLLSSLYVRDFADEPGTQLINVSSVGGYTLVPQAAVYCAAKFFVSAFTEGLAHELRDMNKPMRAKVFAPAATQTEFGKRANDLLEYDYAKAFPRYETAQMAAEHLLELARVDQAMVGIVDRDRFAFSLRGEGLLPYAAGSAQNQAL